MLGWAGLGGERTLLATIDEPALGEAMQPYLLYGWQPQVMAIGGVWKAIRAGSAIEVYDVGADPGEERDRGADAELPGAVRQALREYPLPSTGAPAAGALDDTARERLASLGYFASTAPPKLTTDAPRPREMTHLFAALDLGSGLFARGDYAAAIPVFERLLVEDPGNLSVVLRLAVAHSTLGHNADAVELFDRAAEIDADSLDLDLYRGLHELRGGDWRGAAPRLERVVAAMPERVPALEGLARVRRQEQRIPEAIALYERVIALERAPTAELLEVGDLAMSIGDTAKAVGAFERARQLMGDSFAHHLQLGVLYLDQRRYVEAAGALDQVPRSDANHALALFKRAQVAVLLGESDAAAKITAARREADDVTGPLIESERLFAGY